jgi:catechol 2,3-dioxygenase-like lactoylglutathione lyase family enzyme
MATGGTDEAVFGPSNSVWDAHHRAPERRGQWARAGFAPAAVDRRRRHPAMSGIDAVARSERDPLPAAVELAGVHHAALSVRDVEAASRWYRDVLGLEETFRRQADGQTVVVMHSPRLRTTLGLVEHRDCGHGFSPCNVGLDCLAFAVSSRQALWAWSGRLERCGVAHSGPVDTPFGGMLHFCDRDGIALALFWERGPGAAPGRAGAD